jgi:hypothetical protein
MEWETVIGLETHAQMLNAAHQYQTVSDWHQSVPDA